MKYVTLGCLISFTLSTVAQVVRADDAADSKVIKQQYAKIAAAFVHKDTDELGRLLTEDFTVSFPGQTTIARKQVLALDKAEFPQWIGKPDVQIRCSKVTIKGDTATTQAGATFDILLKDKDGQFGPKGKTHRLKIIDTTNDTWGRSGGGWLAKTEGIKSRQLLLDGKPFHPTPSRVK